MKQIDDIKKDKRIQVKQSGNDGFNGWITIRGQIFFFICSWGGNWDHVSASLTNRCPTWDEMCKIKDIFFRSDECCVEYHPAEKDYVNLHRYCLHIWRPQKETIPTPPMLFV